MRVVDSASGGECRAGTWTVEQAFDIKDAGYVVTLHVF